MKLHVSLRWPASVLLILIWFGLAAFIVFVTAGRAIALIAPAMILGGAAGAMQAASLRAAPDAFRAARSAMDVRRAFRATVWGARYFHLFWAAQAAFLIIALAIAAPIARERDVTAAGFNAVWIFVSLYSGFALARELFALTELPGLKR